MPSNLPPGVTDAMIDNHFFPPCEHCGGPTDECDCAALARRAIPRLVGCVAFTAGLVERKFGGPEEGGWYYDAFTPHRVFIVRADREWRLRTLLGKWRERMNKGRRPLSSVLSDGRYTFHDGIEPATPRPHYE